MPQSAAVNVNPVDLTQTNHAPIISQPRLIILELELEHDLYNPVSSYQDYLRADQSTGTPLDENGIRMKRAGSDRTVQPASIATVLSGQDKVLTDINSRTSLATTSTSEAAHSASTNGSNPTPEQIRESTISKSKPIRALERMRQAEKQAHLRRMEFIKRGARGGDQWSRLSSARRLGATAGSGSLDVFAVLGQVNDQLAAASDLQSLLDVVTGVIKDMTQFHRTLVYQFDVDANGQVR